MVDAMSAQFRLRSEFGCISVDGVPPALFGIPSPIICLIATPVGQTWGISALLRVVAAMGCTVQKVSTYPTLDGHLQHFFTAHSD